MPADYSGRPGARCDMCNRRSEFVGPTRGFDYSSSICGGCYELSDVEDDEVCRGCGDNLYELPSEIDGYCGNCVQMCDACGDLTIAEELVNVILSPAVRHALHVHQQDIDAEERAEEIELHEMKDGDAIEVCDNCATSMNIAGTEGATETQNEDTDSNFDQVMRQAVELGMLTEAGEDAVTDALARGDYSEQRAVKWWAEYTAFRRDYGTSRFSTTGSEWWPTVEVRQYGLVYVKHRDTFGYYVDEEWINPNPTAEEKEEYKDEAEGLEFSAIVQLCLPDRPRVTFASYDVLKPPFEGERIAGADPSRTQSLAFA